MNSKEIIEAAKNKDVDAFSTLIASTMKTKIMEKIEEKRKEVAAGV